MVRNHPELKDSQIIRLVGTTKPTIAAIRDRTHWNSANLSPMDPVTLGLCSQRELDAVVAKAAKNIPAPEVDDEAEVAVPTPTKVSDKDKLIAELHAERAAEEKAASEAAQEAEAAAWLEAKRAGEADGSAAAAEQNPHEDGEAATE